MSPSPRCSAASLVSCESEMKHCSSGREERCSRRGQLRCRSSVYMAWENPGRLHIPMSCKIILWTEVCSGCTWPGKAMP
ncbi:hypothetical protein JRQ81_002458 [Phrynocephalus forsythii]|uniref:Uncharacterized protein n=1 Tax=Phrynocephalus forsythii TaxID=171643 RepID=A0A9Q0XIP3_9SAUR|nr:hypothetical protein JRQ81_002458 [Phrynocephalus forsythii]